MSPLSRDSGSSHPQPPCFRRTSQFRSTLPERIMVYVEENHRFVEENSLPRGHVCWREGISYSHPGPVDEEHVSLAGRQFKHSDVRTRNHVKPDCFGFPFGQTQDSIIRGHREMAQTSEQELSCSCLGADEGG